MLDGNERQALGGGKKLFWGVLLVFAVVVSVIGLVLWAKQPRSVSQTSTSQKICRQKQAEMIFSADGSDQAVVFCFSVTSGERRLYGVVHVIKGKSESETAPSDDEVRRFNSFFPAELLQGQDVRRRDP